MMRSLLVRVLAAGVLNAALLACSANDGARPSLNSRLDGSSDGCGDDAGLGAPEDGTTDPSNPTSWFSDAGLFGETTPGCAYGDDDHDKDGYRVSDGDCADCDPNVNPGAFDVSGNNIDEDCSGKKDDEPTECDANIRINDSSAMNAARALGLCRFADASLTGKKRTWGVLSAKYVMADGSPGMNPLSHGIVDSFGVANVQDGKAMLVLSTGTARADGQPGYVIPMNADMQTSGVSPDGYPKASPHCADVGTDTVANDPAALELVIRVPTNAKSFSFNLNLYTFEFPDYVCSQYNDFYVTLMFPKVPSLPDANISFDQDKAPISVNNSLLQVCNGPVTVLHSRAEGTGRGTTYYPCPLGTKLLEGTGFASPEESGPHAATGWLQTQAPVEPGQEIKLRFAIWDVKDHHLDSTVLIDNFKWSVEPGSAVRTAPVSVPR